MLGANEAATHNQWLADEIQASVVDSRPSIPNEEVMAEMDADIAAHQTPTDAGGVKFKHRRSD